MSRERPTFGSLFAGIGGIDLGLERAGWECRWQVEWDAYCQAVLAKHWPDVLRYGDITTVDWSGVERVDLLAGGFPCQPFSVAGRRKGTADDRWLWPEFAHAIGALRPSLILVENVPGLLAGGGMGAVLGGLAELGYDAQWDSIPAAAVGAPHLRYRVWIVAYRAELAGTLADADIWRPFHEVRAGRYATGDGGQDVPDPRGDEYESGPPEDEWQTAKDILPDTNGKRREVLWRDGLLVTEPPLRGDADGRGSPVADAESIGWVARREGDAAQEPRGREPYRSGGEPSMAHANGTGPQGRAVQPEGASERAAWAGGLGDPDSTSPDAYASSGGPRRATGESGWWSTEPDVGGALDGFPTWLDRSGRTRMTPHALALANAYEGGPREALREVRRASDEAEVRDSVGGSVGVSPAAVLLAYMRQLEDRADEGRLPLACAPTSGVSVRGVPQDEGPARPSRRRRSREQRPGQSPDALHALSQLLARHAGQAWAAYRRENAEPVLSSWAPGWEDGIPRVATGVPARVDRLRALGNAVVPQVVEVIGRQLLEAMNP